MSEQDAEEYLRQKFPKMKPIKGPPTLYSINGFGVGMAGKRNYDQETDTYIATQCLTALFIPIYALRAFRVAPAEGGGWYFLGKEEKSTLAKVWNTMVMTGVLLLVALGIWNARTGSDSYKAGQRLAEAREHESKGERLAAARVYRDMLIAGLPEEEAAKSGISTNLEETMDDGSAPEAVAMMEFVQELPSWLTADGQFVKDLAAQALSTSRRFEGKDPEGAYAVLEAGSAFPNHPEGLLRARRTLLERLVKEKSGKSKYAIALAGAYYEEQKTEDALKLLDPLKDSLGDGEGARIYGQILTSVGRTQEAAVHLEKYIEPRAEAWRAAEKNYERSTESAYGRIIDSLNRNEGPASFYSEHERATSEEEKQRIVDEYVYGRMQRDSSFQNATRKYEQSTAIIPVIMDLGIAQLRSGQSATDPAERKKLLKSAEETFLGLQDSASASGSDEFRFFLGQVYYWSGKQKEGRKLFDELLSANRRDFQTLITLSQTLREVGSIAEARSLAEEAYTKAALPEQKSQAAGQRALLASDTDDEIAWLEKIRGGDANGQIRLASARAQRASENGDREAALKFYREAAEGWANQQPTSATLNNGALVQFSLFNLTGDLSHYESGSAMMERAVALEPDNSILVGNAATTLLGAAIMQTAKGAFHPRIVQGGLGFDALRFLYDSDEERSVLIKKMAANANYRRGIELLEKALVLTPNSHGLHQIATAYYGFMRDAEAVKRLADRAEHAQFDTEEARAESAKNSRGENDDQIREAQAVVIKDWEDILAALNETSQQRFAKIVLSQARLSLFSIGEPGKIDDEIQFLRSAQAEGSSSRLRNALVNALAQKALLALGAENADFATFLARGRRELRPTQLLELALFSESLRPAVLASEHARAALKESLAYSARFPSSRSPSGWAMTTHLDPPQADAVKAEVLKNETEAAAARFAFASTPWSAGVVLTRYQWLLVQGKEVEARALLEKARTEKVPIPVF